MGGRIKHSFGNDHIISALFFAHQAKKIEEENKGSRTALGAIYYKHKAFVTASIITSFASVDATINEFFKDIYDDIQEGHSFTYPEIDLPTRQTIAALWNIDAVHSANTLKKYKLAFEIIKKTTPDTGNENWKNIKPIQCKVKCRR